MEQQQRGEPLSVYMTISEEDTPLSISIKPYGGEDGYREYLEKNVKAVEDLSAIPNRRIYQVNLYPDQLPALTLQPEHIFREVRGLIGQGNPYRKEGLYMAVFCAENGIDLAAMDKWEKSLLTDTPKYSAFVYGQQWFSNPRSLYFSVRPDMTCENVEEGIGTRGFKEFLKREFAKNKTYDEGRSNLYLHMDSPYGGRMLESDTSKNEQYLMQILNECKEHIVITNMMTYSDVMIGVELSDSNVIYEKGYYANKLDRYEFGQRAKGIDINTDAKDFPVTRMVSTGSGVLLFSDTPDGQNRMRNYLQYEADKIMHPDSKGVFLTISTAAFLKHEAVIAKIDAYPASPVAPQSDMFADKGSFELHCDQKNYRLIPAGPYIDKFTSAEYGEDLRKSSEMYDKMCLDYITDNGLPPEGFADIYPEIFSHTEKFEPYRDRMAYATCPIERHNINKEAVAEAVKLSSSLMKDIKHRYTTEQSSPQKGLTI